MRQPSSTESSPSAHEVDVSMPSTVTAKPLMELAALLQHAHSQDELSAPAEPLTASPSVTATSTSELRASHLTCATESMNTTRTYSMTTHPLSALLAVTPTSQSAASPVTATYRCLPTLYAEFCTNNESVLEVVPHSEGGYSSVTSEHESPVSTVQSNPNHNSSSSSSSIPVQSVGSSMPKCEVTVPQVAPVVLRGFAQNEWRLERVVERHVVNGRSDARRRSAAAVLHVLRELRTKEAARAAISGSTEGSADSSASVRTP